MEKKFYPKPIENGRVFTGVVEFILDNRPIKQRFAVITIDPGQGDPCPGTIPFIYVKEKADIYNEEGKAFFATAGTELGLKAGQRVSFLIYPEVDKKGNPIMDRRNKGYQLYQARRVVSTTVAAPELEVPKPTVEQTAVAAYAAEMKDDEDDYEVNDLVGKEEYDDVDDGEYDDIEDGKYDDAAKKRRKKEWQ